VRIHRRYGNSEYSWVECERELLGFTHAELGADILREWNLPEQIQIAVREHHSPAPLKPGSPIPLSRALDAANQYVNASGESILLHQRNDGAGSAWVASLGIEPDQLDRLLADFDMERKALAPFFR